MLGRIAPRSVDDVVRAVRRSEQRGQSLSIAGARHAMGRQQFATDAWLLDMRSMDKVLDFDRDRGIIHAQAGITWPDLMRHYVIAQRDGASAPEDRGFLSRGVFSCYRPVDADRPIPVLGRRSSVSMGACSKGEPA